MMGCVLHQKKPARSASEDVIPSLALRAGILSGSIRSLRLGERRLPGFTRRGHVLLAGQLLQNTSGGLVVLRAEPGRTLSDLALERFQLLALDGAGADEEVEALHFRPWG